MRKLALGAAVAFSVVAIAACGSETTDQPSAAEPTSIPSPVATAVSSPTIFPTRTALPAPTPVRTPTLTSEIIPTVDDNYPDIKFVDDAVCRGINTDRLPLADVMIRNSEHFVAFAVEVADTPADQSQGLMCREEVPGGTGMLFTWSEPRTAGFWMFNTHVPLDILYLDRQGFVVSFREMQPCLRIDHHEEVNEWTERCGGNAAPYRPNGQYVNALELPQGWLDSQGFDTSDPGSFSVTFSLRD